ncbi:winged helix-turn-helix domain-containing protein [Enterococcus rivorum]|uniref:OmpR/PhoB-type domain-containing protein n=1 Tax=Enterococcus rivorum TaxID=762845 RepID=A0A1E5KSW2_9ENTE|nr:winged helix-turn-helix domain-containing protein [Enterococcus rivorum]MBP2100783.1 hypothetical protein [Enterococcus rivorum]OEH80950.1 hypothetical protein BCR26_17810 [Enterococcus rivorum]
MIYIGHVHLFSPVGEQDYTLFPEKIYSVVSLDNLSVERTEILNTVHGIILDARSDEKFIETCEALTLMNQNKSLFLWVISSVQPHEREVFLHLGAHCIYETWREAVFSIKNFFSVLYLPVPPKNKNISINESNRTILLDGTNERSLTQLEFKLFLLLYQNPEEIFSYEQIANYLWEQYKSLEDTKTKYRVANLIHLLRNKLNDSNMQLIKTLRNRGYYFQLPK